MSHYKKKRVLRNRSKRQPTVAAVRGTPFDLPDRWTEMRYHAEQARLVKSTARFKVVPAGRRSGKTERAKRKLVREAMHPSSRYPDPRYFAAAPTRDQAKRIYWEDLKLLSPKQIIHAISETDLTITYMTGAQISVVGMDKPERIEGSPWDGGILDEYANMKKEAWRANVRPALADRKGWCWLIGVPEGRNHYYDTAMDAQGAFNVANGGDWDFFTWHSADILDAEEVESAQRDLDELTFRQEYEASFVNFEGQCYYPFDRGVHSGPVYSQYDPRGDLIFCFDFNVDPGVAVVCQEMEFQHLRHQPGRTIAGKKMLENVELHAQRGTAIIGEVYIPRNSNTVAVCRKLAADWGGHQGDIFIYGDATGGARGTSQTEGSDWDIVRRELHSAFDRHKLYVRVPDSNPTERARINAVNTRLKAGDGTVRLAIDPNMAPYTVKDFEGVRLLEGGSGEIDKKNDPKLTHLTDSVGYYIAKEFPIRKQRTIIQRVEL